MMTEAPIVVDASVAIAAVRDEAEGRVVNDALRMWRRNRRRIVVPSHFWLELVNALALRHRWSGADILHAVHDLDHFQLETIVLDRPSVVLTLDLVERHGLTAYDATYLALAESIDGLLVTLDRALRVAAGPRALDPAGARLSETSVAYERTVTWPDYAGSSAYLASLRVAATATGRG